MPRRPQTARQCARLTAAVGALVAGLTLLSGCTQSAPAPTVSAGTSPPPTASATPTPDAPPVLVPEGSAADNLPLFAEVVQTVWAGPENASGRAYIDALVAAGFDKGAMEVTEDLSTVGNPAESLQFSVLWGSECLIGQVGPATGDPLAVVVAALPEGGCLIGRTRLIDW